VTKSGNGSGTVTGTGISCGADCSEPIFDGKAITLSATTVLGSVFDGFTGDCVSSTPTCTFVPTGQSRNVSAAFRLAPTSLKVQIEGAGTVTGLPGADPCVTSGCTYVVDYGTPVNLLLQAVPSSSPASEFVSWDDCTTKTNASCTFTSSGLKVNTSVKATFRPTVSSVTIVPGGIDPSIPVLKGAKRQYNAVALFSDGSQQDVTTQATWSSNASAILTIVPTSGLATGVATGTTSVSVTFRTVTASLGVAVDTFVPGTLSVSCAPYGVPIGDPGVVLSCLPSGLGFEVECRATAAFAANPSVMQEVTDQVTWASTTAVGFSLGLSDFTGTLRQSFQIRSNGTAALYATGNGQTSSKDLTPTNPWVVQGVTSAVTGITLTATPNPIPAGGQPLQVRLGQPAQLAAMATLTGGCASPPTRDFSLRTAWSTVPAGSPVASVTFFGLVEPLGAGSVSVHWIYSGALNGDVPITVVP
jgi:hypothetical protein